MMMGVGKLSRFKQERVGKKAIILKLLRERERQLVRVALMVGYL